MGDGVAGRGSSCRFSYVDKLKWSLRIWYIEQYVGIQTGRGRKHNTEKVPAGQGGGGYGLLLVGSACVRGRGSVCVSVLAYAKISYEMCCEIQFSWIFIYFASLLARGTCPATPPPTPSC